MEALGKFQGNQKQNLFHEETPLTQKIFIFFYILINTKTNYNELIIAISIVIENIQLVSFIFDEPHTKTWKNSNIKNLNKIIGSLRISTLFKYFSKNVYATIFFIICFSILFFIIFIIVQIRLIKQDNKLMNISIIIVKYIIYPFIYLPIAYTLPPAVTKTVSFSPADI